MFRIDNLNRIFETTLILPVSKTVEFSFPFEDSDAWIKIVYKDTDDHENRLIDLSGENGKVILTFVNWSNSLGTALTEPVKFATSSQGKDLLLLAASWRIGTVNRLDFQVFVGDPK